MTAEDIIGCKLKVVSPRPEHEEYSGLVGEWVINSSDEVDCSFYMKWYEDSGRTLKVSAFYPDEVEIVEKRDVEEAIQKTNLLAETATQLLEAMGYYDQYINGDENEITEESN